MELPSKPCPGNNDGTDPASPITETSPAEEKHKQEDEDHYRYIRQNIPDF